MTQTISAVTTIIAPTISSSGTTTTTSTGPGPATTRIVIDRKVANRSETFATMRNKVVERLGGGGRMAAGPRCWSTVPLLSAAVFLLLLSSFGEHPFAKDRGIIPWVLG
ncbi:hypothetical protein ZHAS_00013056 [Anopheles sinensis]|uniref:Uncharacterized protein n=1 Tax=Anopheles sinensis TaxID=74873 RepID=A0A084W4S7_ANOSI|nr:hypothetical protein ZHAS_00013056 [Anopheles sinensis]